MSRALIGVLALHLVSACGNATGAKQSPDYGRIPLGFEQNRGQTDGSVKFLARGGDSYIFITGGKAVISLKTGRKASAVSMQLVDARRAAVPAGELPLGGYSNYFIGNDPS